MGSDAHNIVKSLAKVVFRTPFGRSCSRALHCIGVARVSGWSSRLTHYAPAQIEFHVERRGEAHAVRMHTLGGNDQVAFAVWCRGLWGYEPSLPALYARLAANARTIIGAGANSGFYELIAAAVSPDARIFAFEPFPEAYEALRQNIALNEFQDIIEALAVAVSNEIGTARLYVPAKTHGTVLEHSSSLNPDFRPDHSDAIEVPVTTLDHFVAERRIARVDLVRADVESTEHLVLAGAAHVFEAHRPIVVIEVLADADCAALEKLRARYGYVAYCVTERSLQRCAAVVHRAGVQNQVLCPEERVAELEKLAEGLLDISAW